MFLAHFDACFEQGYNAHMFATASMAAADGKVFCYKKPMENQPFLLGLTSDFFVDKAIELGHGRALQMDATFGVNIHKVKLHVHGCSQRYHRPEVLSPAWWPQGCG